MSIPTGLKYTKDHEWAKIEGNTVTVGITDHAQSSLGDIVFADLPQKGRAVKKGESFGVVESIKAVSDLYAPVSGTVLESNGALSGEPSSINQSPYDSWMVKIQVTDPASMSDLMDAQAYEAHVASLT